MDASWHPCPERIEAALKARRGRVAAVLACSTFGTAPDSSIAAAWREASVAHDVGLVVDSAAGFGASSERGELLGAQGDAEVFSFHATKSFAVGEGGLVTSTDPEIAERIARLANFGFSAERTIEGAVGLNAKMSEWHAATALAVLDGYDAVVERRRRAGARIEERLASRGFRFQRGREGSVWQFVPALAPTPEARQRSLERARAARIEVRTYFDPPLHRMSAFSGVELAGTLEVTERLAKCCISLPMANDLSESETERICAAVAAG
jgi:dTDP-4-amino-4,6-dideoxygalactose transaminase